MNARACVNTTAGTAAIAAVHLTGPDAAEIIKQVFQPAGRAANFTAGDVRVGNLVDADRIIDHVVVACRSLESFDITCHGNPLIVEMIVKLLQAQGAEVWDTETTLKQDIAAQSTDAITAEARFRQLQAVTLAGVKIIANQIPTGLVPTVRAWLSNIEFLDLDRIKTECREILTRSGKARLLIDGCKAVIAGPPNSGKSTLLNYLAGRQKAIVTDIAGTTRDWVTATCKVGPVMVELIDTAGLDESLKKKTHIDKEAQQKSAELLTDCDLILYVIDASKSTRINRIETHKPLLTLLNKSDLGCSAKFETGAMSPEPFLKISAKTGAGVDRLPDMLQTFLSLNDLDKSLPVSFTARQTALLTQLAAANDKTSAKSLIAQLLNAPASV